MERRGSSATLVGPLIAGLEAALAPANVTLSAGSVAIGSTDGTATGGPYVFSPSTADLGGPQAASGRQITAVTYSSGSSTLNGNFATGDVGKFVANSATSPDTGLGSTNVITSVNPGVSATISGTTTAANTSGGGATIGTGSTMTFTDPSVSTGNIFTTNGTLGGQSNIGLVGAGSFTLTATVTLAFGGTDGVGSTNCVLTGWDSVRPQVRPRRVKLPR